MIQFLRVKKEYGDKNIISIPELILPEGIYWLKGANGSGKTTLLKMIAGLIPFSGNILLHGVSQRLKPTEYRYLQSYAEAEPSYPPFLTGQELIRFIQDIRKIPVAVTEALIERLDIGNFLNTAIGTYSSGMIKRFSLLLSFMGHPKLILLDEPLATLDSEVAAILPILMMEYQNIYGCSFIFSSHTSFPEEKLILNRELLLQNETIQFPV
jgi:ABC-2 type transport system ATP-binding protein